MKTENLTQADMSRILSAIGDLSTVTKSTYDYIKEVVSSLDNRIDGRIAVHMREHERDCSARKDVLTLYRDVSKMRGIKIGESNKGKFDVIMGILVAKVLPIVIYLALGAGGFKTFDFLFNDNNIDINTTSINSNSD